MFRPEIIKIVGRANKRWGQTFAENNLFLILEIEGIEKAVEIGHQIIKRIEKDYRELSEKSLKSVKKLLASLELKGNINLIIGVVKKNILYLAGQGEGEVMIKRGKSWGTILRDTGNSSGHLQEEDIIIFSSPSFKKLVSSDKLQELLISSSLKEVGEHLATLTQTAKENEGVAGLLIQFLREGKEKSLKEQIIDKVKQLSNLRNNFLPSFRISLLKEGAPMNHAGFMVSELEKGRRLTASVALILIILLIGSLLFGSFQKEKSLQKQELEKIKEKVLPQISEGKQLIDLNILQARRVLSEAKTSLEENLPKFKSNSKESKEAQKILEEVNQALLSAQRDVKLSQVPIFFDLVWIKEEARGSSLALYQDNLVILDQETKSVYQLDISTKKSQILGGGEDLSSASKIALHGDRVFILLKGEEAKIVNLKMETVIENDEEWGDIADFTAYAGNLYLLDKKGAIWKYSRLETGFGPRQNYLAHNVTPDFTQASAMTIDGSIWVLNQGWVTKFVQGAPQSFSFQGLEEDLKEPVDLFINEESKNIYLLDKQGKIVVFDKEGRYHAQYSWEKLSEASDFVVSESLGKILVLVKGKIYAIEMVL